jgi:hypothetical protein
MNEPQKDRKHHSEQSGWPQSADSLLTTGSDWETLASIGGADWDGFLLYAQSYKEAADIVVEQIESAGRRQDSIVYAIMFLYRHYIELMIKGLIRLGSMLEGSPPHYPKGHIISELWRQCEPMLKAAFPEGDKSAAKTVENCIMEMAQLDPSGEAWRFPEDKKERAIQHRISCLSLRNVRKVMDNMAGYLEGSYDGMDELLQYDDGPDSINEPG